LIQKQQIKKKKNLKKKIDELKAQVEEEIRLKRRAQNEKGDILVEIEKTKSYILTSQSKNEELKSNMSKLRDRTVELQQQIDQFNRENKQADDEARKLNLQSQDQLNQLNDKNKQVEDYNSSLGMGGGVEQKLKQQREEEERQMKTNTSNTGKPNQA